MSGNTSIEWTQATWNPTTGCDKVSPGCDHCYAMTLAKRLKGMGSAAYQLDGPAATSGPGFLAHEWPRALDWPLHKTKPLLIFVNSMSDLFHANISDEYIARVFAVMALAPRHTFQVLTKRHARMKALLSSADFRAQVSEHASDYIGEKGPGMWPALDVNGAGDGWRVVGQDRCGANIWAPAWPLPNVWLGVSTESQQWANLRIPALLHTPAAVRFISAEPLLGPIDLVRMRPAMIGGPLSRSALAPVRDYPSGEILEPRLDWVIVGGESGPGARPMHPDWARTLRDECTAADVAFLFKQWGEWRPALPWRAGEPMDEQSGRPSQQLLSADGLTFDATVWRVGKKAAGRILDGRTWDEYPVAK